MGVKGIICFHVGVSIPLTISRCVWNLNDTSYVPFSLHPSFSLPSCLLISLMYWEGLFIPILSWILILAIILFSWQEIQCYVCKNFGHLCCVDFLDLSPRHVSCYSCGQTGHLGPVSPVIYFSMIDYFVCHSIFLVNRESSPIL